jgi:hypothetical protein
MEQAVTDINDQLLTRYLLGSLTAEESERLAELSVTDDDVSTRLDAIENDLVDAFVKGELSGQAADQFKTAYLSSPKRHEKLKFAETLYAHQQRLEELSAASRVATLRPRNQASIWSLFRLPGLVPQWGLAGAALLLLLTSGYLASSNHQLRQRIDRGDAERASLAQKEQELSSQLADRQSGDTVPQSASPASAIQPSAGQPSPDRGLDRLNVAAFVLLPSMRDASRPPSVSVSKDTDLIVLKLELESNDFSRYKVSIQDSASRQTVWHSFGRVF